MVFFRLLDMTIIPLNAHYRTQLLVTRPNRKGEKAQQLTCPVDDGFRLEYCLQLLLNNLFVYRDHTINKFKFFSSNYHLKLNPG